MQLSSLQHAVSKHSLKNVFTVTFSALLCTVSPLLSSKEVKRGIQKVLKEPSCKYANAYFSFKRCLCLTESVDATQGSSPLNSLLHCASPAHLDETNQICFSILELEGFLCFFLLSPYSAGAAKCPCLGRG